MTQRSLRIALLASLLLASGGCGFALKDNAPLPRVLGSVAIQAADPDSLLVQDLERELEAAGAALKPLGSAGASTLKIESETTERNVISLDDRAKVGEYGLYYRVRYALSGPDGQSLLRETAVEFSRVYSFDEQQAIGAAQEEEIIRDELRRDAVRTIIEGLRRVRQPGGARADRESAVAR